MVCGVQNCYAGTIASAVGAERCTECEIGRFTAVNRSTLCQNCNAGHMAPYASSTTCTACGAGTYAAGVSAGECALCPLGTYSEISAATTCMSCPSDAQTTNVQSTSASDCLCKNNHRMVYGNDEYTTAPGNCTRCGAGEVCEFSSNPLLQLYRDAGYWRGVDNELLFIECPQGVEACPGWNASCVEDCNTAANTWYGNASQCIAEQCGDWNATCGKGYDGPVCGSCDDGFAKGSSGHCEECLSGNNTVIIAVLFLIVGTGVFALTAKKADELGIRLHKRRRRQVKEKNAEFHLHTSKKAAERLKTEEEPAEPPETPQTPQQVLKFVHSLKEAQERTKKKQQATKKREKRRAKGRMENHKHVHKLHDLHFKMEIDMTKVEVRNSVIQQFDRAADLSTVAGKLDREATLAFFTWIYENHTNLTNQQAKDHAVKAVMFIGVQVRDFTLFLRLLSVARLVQDIGGHALTFDDFEWAFAHYIKWDEGGQLKAYEERIRQQFDQLDINGDHTLTLDEIKQLLEKMGVGYGGAFEEPHNERDSVGEMRDSEGEIKIQRTTTVSKDVFFKKMLGEMDTDGDNEISFEEFKEAYKTLLQTQLDKHKLKLVQEDTRRLDEQERLDRARRANFEASPILLTKVFISGIQVTQLAQSFDLQWPQFLKDLFATQRTASGGSLFLVDCLFPDGFAVVYLKAATVLFLALVVVPFILVLFWTLVYFRGRARIPSLNPVDHPPQKEILETHAVADKLAELERQESGKDKDDTYQITEETKRRLGKPETDVLQEYMPHAALVRLGIRQPTKTLVLDEDGNAYEQEDLEVDVPELHGFQHKWWEAGEEERTIAYDAAKKFLKDSCWDRFICCFSVSIFFAHPIAVITTLSMLSCTTVDGKERLYADTSLVCYDLQHIEVLASIGLVGLTFIFGVPVYTYFRLKHASADIIIGEYSVSRQLAFVFADFKDEYLWWESIIQTRKLAMGAVVAVLAPAGVETQTLCALGVLVMCIAFQVRNHPYQEDLIDQLEMVSLGTSFCTLYFGLMLSEVTRLRTEQEALGDSQGRVNSALRVGGEILTLMIVAVNFGYVIIYLWYLGRIMKAKAFEKYFVARKIHEGGANISLTQFFLTKYSVLYYTIGCCFYDKKLKSNNEVEQELAIELRESKRMEAEVEAAEVKSGGLEPLQAAEPGGNGEADSPSESRSTQPAFLHVHE